MSLVILQGRGHTLHAASGPCGLPLSRSLLGIKDVQEYIQSVHEKFQADGKLQAKHFHE